MRPAEVVQAVSKQSKSVVMRLTPTHIHLMADESTSSKCRFWCSISAGHMFSSYLVEGVPNTPGNEFYIETRSDSLSKTLKLVNSSSRSLCIRLAKSADQPVLNVLIEEPASIYKWREVSHNIPIFIMSRRLWAEYAKGELPVQVRFDMPNMTEFAAVARRIKSLENRVTVSLTTDANNSRCMTVSSISAGCVIRRKFRSIRLSAQTGAPVCDEVPEDPNKIQIDVESKMLHQFLNAFRKKNVNLTIGILQRKYMTLSMASTDFSIDYVIPAFNN